MAARQSLAWLALAVCLLTSSEAPAQVGFSRDRPDPWLYGPGNYGYKPYYYPSLPTELTYRSYYPPVQRVHVVAQPAEASVQVTVGVPADALVWFDGAQTTQTGAVRRFVSPPLLQGKHYSYEITAQWLKDGQPVTEKRAVRFDSGKQSQLSVAFQ